MSKGRLAALNPHITYDTISGSLVSTLKDRLRAHIADVGVPRRLIIELGTNTDPAWTKQDYLDAVKMVPRSTQVLMVTPYDPPNHTGDWSRGTYASRRTYWYARWMNQIARERPNVCVVPWRGTVLKHPNYLWWAPGSTPKNADAGGGVHPTAYGERVWARLIDRAMHAPRCQGFRKYL